MKFTGSKCRFCKTDLNLEIGDAIAENHPEVYSLAFTLKDRCCCNRCADYKRKIYDLTYVLSKIALEYDRSASGYQPNEKIITVSKEAIDRIVRKIIMVAEDHYLLTGLVNESFQEFYNMVLEKPDSVWIIAKNFDSGVATMASEYHRQGRKAPEPLQYKDA